MGLYAKIDVNLPKDRSIRRAGPLAELLYIRCILLAKEVMSDGVVDESQLPLAAVDIPGKAKDHAAKLVAVGLWEKTETGWRVPLAKWDKYQTTAAEVEDKRQKRSEAGKKGAKVRWQNGKRNGKRHGTPQGNVKTAECPESESETESETEPLTTPFPPELSREDCQDALREWIEHRKQKRKPATGKAVEQLLKQWARAGPAAFVEAIEHSIANGWDGVYAPKPGDRNRGTDKNQRSAARIEAPAGKYEDLEIHQG